MPRFLLVILAALTILIAGGCNLNATPASTPIPTAVSVVSPGWELAAPGIETRGIRVEAPYSTTPFSLIVARIDPAQVTFRVHYQPREWQTLPQWQTSLNDPLLVVNGSFFNELGDAVGLVVADGQRHGVSLRGYGGMFQLIGQDVRVRSLVAEPFQDDAFDQVVQGFPMLVEPGGLAASTGEGFDTPARRTMIAQDRQGRILLMVTPLGQLTLRNAQQWLLSSDLDINVAVNLDGGKSTALYLGGDEGTFYPSIDPIPVVIAVYPR